MNGEEVKDRALELAGQAVESAMEDDWAAASAAVLAVNDQLGGTGMFILVTAWCDTLFTVQRRAAGMPDELLPSEAVAPLWVNEDDAVTADAGDVTDAGFRWAGQLLAARAAMDSASYRALLSVPAAGETGHYVSCLLYTVAAGLRDVLGGVS